jgi:hypothetical protein
MSDGHAPGDEWENHYRGYRLHTNQEGDVWWQVYDGTDRLYLDPTPDDLVEQLLTVKRLGGRIRVTEGNDVIAKEERGDDYETIWIGTLSLSGELVPADDPEYSIDIQPDNLSPGDLWPSVYDGAKYSFGPGAERVWWSNSGTHKRHPVTSDLPTDITERLARYKPQGGSLRVTPWNDVITLVDAHPASDNLRQQFNDLPRVVKNIIKLRKERGVEKLPVYLGSIDETPLTVAEPDSLTDQLSTKEQSELESWASSLGSTTSTDPEDHSIDDSDENDIPHDDPTDW